MMQILKKLQTLSPLQNIIIVVVMGVLWFLPDVCGTPYPQETYAFVVLNQYQCFALPALWAHVVQYFCWVIIMYCVTQLCDKRRILPVRSAVPIVVLAAVGSACNHWQFFSASTVAFICWLLALSQLLSMYEQKKECIAQAFNCGLFIICATLFDFDYIWFVPLLLLGAILFGSLTARTFCTFLAGMSMPIILVVGGFVLGNRLPELTADLLVPTLFDFDRAVAPFASEVAFAVVLCIAFAASLLHRFIAGAIFSLHTRLNYIFISCGLFYALIVAIALVRFDTLLLVPFLFLMLIICFFFATNTTAKCANILFWILLSAVVVCRTLAIFAI
ncbi:MAG: hypothetical protein ACI392_04510 [Paludibacteraceae bacterium]